MEIINIIIDTVDDTLVFNLIEIKNKNKRINNNL